MRTRAAILIVVLAGSLAGSLTACSSDSDASKTAANASDAATRLTVPTAPVTEVTLDCAKYSDTAQKIVAAEQALFTGSDTAASLAALTAELEALKDGAPDNVKAAIDDLVDAFGKIAGAKDGSAASSEELSQLGPKLGQDSITLTTYIATQCR